MPDGAYKIKLAAFILAIRSKKQGNLKVAFKIRHSKKLILIAKSEQL